MDPREQEKQPHEMFIDRIFTGKHTVSARRDIHHFQCSTCNNYYEIDRPGQNPISDICPLCKLKMPIGVEENHILYKEELKPVAMTKDGNNIVRYSNPEDLKK